MIRVSDYIINHLYKIGIKHIFLISGGGSMHLNDAVAMNKKIKYICTHHEQAAAIAADVYSRVTQNFGAAMVTTGPGGTNAITGLLGAWQDSTSCIFLSGQGKKKETIFNAKIPGLRQFGPQEVNIIPIVSSLTKYAVMVNEKNKIRYHLEKAIYLAKSGRPGPVWLDIPHDIQGALIDPDKLDGFDYKNEIAHEKEKATQDLWNDLLNLIRTCKKPLIIVGNGIRLSHANDLFLELTRRYQIPIVTSNMAIDVTDHDNSLFIGVAGQKGHRGANIAIQNADLLISIGCRLSISLIGFEYDKFAPQAKKIVIDIDQNEHKKKTIKIDLFIKSDARLFIEEFLKRFGEEKFNFKKDWPKKLKNLTVKYPVCLPEYARIKGPVNIYYAVKLISDHLKSDAIIISDAGLPYYMVGQTIKIKNGQRLILPGATAGLGFNLPASIGASVGAKMKNVICITGDGSLQTNIHELGTIALNRLPIKIFILNNSGYLSIRISENTFFHGRLIGESNNTGLGFPVTSKIAAAYGINYFFAGNNNKLKDVIPKVLDCPGPVLCEIACQKN